jgi:hypothetical protein
MAASKAGVESWPIKASFYAMPNGPLVSSEFKMSFEDEF